MFWVLPFGAIVVVVGVYYLILEEELVIINLMKSVVAMCMRCVMSLKNDD